MRAAARSVRHVGAVVVLFAAALLLMIVVGVVISDDDTATKAVPVDPKHPESSTGDVRTT